MTPSIVFMGTPDFAVYSLRALHRAKYDVRLVVTQPDRPKGRGRTLTAPPVKRWALEFGFDCVQPPRVRTPEFAARLRELSPDFLVVVAFGQILSTDLLKIPKFGPINVHASLLPKYRGPAPIQWAVLRRESVTGVTTMLMDAGVDTGDVLLSSSTAIEPRETAQSLHDRLAEMGAQLLIDPIEGLISGTLFPQAQKHGEATYAPMLKKGDGHLRWQLPAVQLDALVRAMTPWPGAYCFLGKQRLRVHQSRILEMPHQAEPGTVLDSFPGELRVATGNGILAVIEIQLEGGRRMCTREFLAGHAISAGTRLN